MMKETKTNKDRKAEEISLNIDPQSGVKGDTVEYGYHRGDDVDFCDGSEWRQVKKDIALCIAAAKKNELHQEITYIEKIWHNERTEESWLGYASLWASKGSEWE